MSKPPTIHTVESLKARAVEEGECLIWQGYYANGVPMVHQGGKMVPVRKVLLKLQEIPITGRYLAPKCGNPGCIDPAHIVQRTEATHARQMAKQANTTHRAKRMAGLIRWRQANPNKLDMDKARAIRADERPSRVVAEDYGVSKSLVCRIKAGTYWQDRANPFAGLMR